MHGVRRDGEVADRSDAEWHWSWSYRGDGRASLLHLFNRATGFQFVGVPPERVGEIAPFPRFDELTQNGRHPYEAREQLHAEWCEWVHASSESAQRDRKHAIPRMIVEHDTGRDAQPREIAAVAKLCNHFDKTQGGKTYAVSAANVAAALDGIGVPALF